MPAPLSYYVGRQRVWRAFWVVTAGIAYLSALMALLDGQGLFRSAAPTSLGTLIVMILWLAYDEESIDTRARDFHSYATRQEQDNENR